MANGLLPPGIHTCSLAEVEATFAYNIKRRQLFEGLEILINDLKSIFSPAIFIDGSFVTQKIIPGDIDICWEEGTGTNYGYEITHLPILFNQAAAKKHYLADIFPSNIMETNSKKLFIDFFQFDKNTNEKKGILKIELL